MDDELQQLEMELKRLRPVAPAARLVRRVERELAAAPRERETPARVPWWWAATPLATAAAIVMVMAQAKRWDRPAEHRGGAVVAESTADVLKPVAAENVLVAARDEGLVTLADGTPARRARLQYVDTITWKNPRTNASLTWTVPREEVRVVPIALQ